MGMTILAMGGQVAAEVRPEVVERISPIGSVVVTDEAGPAAASTTAAAPAAAAPPVAQVAPAPPVAQAAPAPAAAPTPAAGASEGAALYTAKGCSACHGPDGRKTAMPVYPKIAGQSSAYLVAQMKDINSGARANGQAVIMKGIIAQVSDAEMQTIADWLSTQ